MQDQSPGQQIGKRTEEGGPKTNPEEAFPHQIGHPCQHRHNGRHFQVSPGQMMRLGKIEKFVPVGLVRGMLYPIRKEEFEQRQGIEKGLGAGRYVSTIDYV